MTTIDTEGKTVKITEDNLVRIDGIGVFRRIQREGVLYLQFMDTDRYRAKCRGSKFVEIPLHILLEKINHVQGTKEKANGLNASNPAKP
jgi:hypothetical protein